MIYTFTVDPGQCALNGSLTVNISTNPTIDITNAILTNESCNQMDGSISGIAINNGTPNFNYQWNNNPSLNTLDLQGLTAGTYALEVTDQWGCTATTSVVIDENQAPTIDASGIVVEQPTCLQGGQINGLLVNGNGPFDYQWTNSAQTTLSINSLTDGSYSLLVTDVNGCTVNYGPVAIVTPEGPTAAFTWSPNEPYIGNNVTFTNNSIAVTNFNSEWTIGSLTFNATNLDHSFEDNGTYTVQLIVTDMNDCMDTIVQTIYVIGDVTIPNILTLNDDGANEVFLIDGLKDNSSLVIINRWGNVVFETTNYLNDWKGTNKQSGDRVLDGVYTYLLTEPDGSKKHGFIHIVH
jgi:gliding motility-associated-like protein